MIYPIFRLFRLQTILLFNISKWHYFNCKVGYAAIVWLAAFILWYAMTVSCLTLFLYKPGEQKAAPVPDWFIRPIFKYVSRGYKKNCTTHTDRYEWRKFLHFEDIVAFFQNLSNYLHGFKVT